MKKQYIGITGVKTVQEAQDTIELYNNAGITMETDVIPMIGILATKDSLYGQNYDATRRRTPAGKDLAPILEEANKGSLAMIHYCNFSDHSFLGDVAPLFTEMYEANICRSVQLNMEWPDIAELESLKKDFSLVDIVFQLSPDMIAEGNPELVANKVADYKGLIDYLLIDPSQGAGLDFDAKELVPVYSALKDKLPDVMIGFAGGLSKDNVYDQVSKIKKELSHTNFIIDAEGKLRTNQGGDNILSSDEMKGYLLEAARAYCL